MCVSSHVTSCCKSFAIKPRRIPAPASHAAGRQWLAFIRHYHELLFVKAPPQSVRALLLVFCCQRGICAVVAIRPQHCQYKARLIYGYCFASHPQHGIREAERARAAGGCRHARTFAGGGNDGACNVSLTLVSTDSTKLTYSVGRPFARVASTQSS